MFVDPEDKIQIHKSMKMKEYIGRLKEYHTTYGETSPFVAHFRISTQGGVNLENAHPFPVNADLAMAHNGIISQFSGPNARKTGLSDTRLFVLNVLRKLPPDFLSNEVAIDLIRSFVGGDKLVFLGIDKSLSIFNEKAGILDEGVWYSNGGFKSWARYTRNTWKGSKYSCRQCYTNIGAIVYNQQLGEWLCPSCQTN